MVRHFLHPPLPPLLPAPPKDLPLFSLELCYTWHSVPGLCLRYFFVLFNRSVVLESSILRTFLVKQNICFTKNVSLHRIPTAGHFFLSGKELIIYHLLCEAVQDSFGWGYSLFCCCCSVAKSCLTLQPHGLQHVRLPCPPLSPRVSSNSRPLSR